MKKQKWKLIKKTGYIFNIIFITGENTMKCITITEKTQSKVIKAVIKSMNKYSLTSGDLQTIIIACKKYQHELDKLENKTKNK